MSAGQPLLIRILAAAGLLAISWGALAFGAVYPWAYAPLAVVCATTGVVAFGLARDRRPRLGWLLVGLCAIAGAIAIQAVPLPAALIDAVSPHAAAFLGESDGALASGAATASSATAFSLSPGYTLLALALFSSLALFFIGMAKVLSASGARMFCRALVMVGVLLALIGIVQYVLTGGETYLMKIYGFWQPQFRASPFGPFVNRNHFAGWMIMVLPLALGAGVAAFEEGRALRSGGLGNTIAWLSTPSGAGTLVMLFAALVMGLSLLMAQSRSGMAGFAGGTLIFAFVIVRRQATVRAKAGAAALCGLLLIAAAAWAGVDRVAGRVASVQDDAGSAGGRRQAWADAVRIARDFPLTGTGLDTFGTAMLLYQTNRELHFQEAHNDYLQLAAEGGLLVGIPIFATIVIFARQVRRRFAEAPKHGSTYWLRVGAVAGLLSIAMQSLVEFSLQMPGNAALFAVLAAIAIHQSPNLRKSHGSPRRQQPA